MLVKKIIMDMLPSMWPLITFVCVVAISMRLTFLKGSKKFILYKELMTLVFIIYILCLYYVVTGQDMNPGTNNFIPFKEIMRYDVTSSLFYRNVIGNILLFIPFGYMITDMLRLKAGKCNIFIASLLTILTSLSTEVIQMFIGRSFDIDDIFLNFIGGLFGFVLYYIFHFIYKKLPERYHNNGFKLMCYLMICLIFITLFALFYTMR